MPTVGRLGYTVAAPIVFYQEIPVHYGQFYVESRTDDFLEGLTESRGGQANGLCGAAVPGLSEPPRRRWGGRLPDERVRRTKGALALDRDLDGVADLDPATQCAVAVWAARRARPSKWKSRITANAVVSGHDVTFSIDGVQGNAYDTFTNRYTFSAACPVGVVQGDVADPNGLSS